MGDADLSSSLEAGTRLQAWRGRASLLYGYTSADRVFKGSSETANVDELRMRLNLLIASLGLDAPFGTGLTVTLPFASLWHASIYKDVAKTDNGLGDVEVRLRQDVGAVLGWRGPTRLALTAGVAAPTGLYNTSSQSDTFSVGRGTWWLLADADASQDLNSSWALIASTGLRIPTVAAPGGLMWGNEVRGSAGVRWSLPIAQAWLPQRLTAVLSGEYQFRAKASQTLQDGTEEFKKEIGGHFLTVTPTLVASLTDMFYVSVSARLPVWRDANSGEDSFFQLVPNEAFYVSLGGLFGGGPRPVVATAKPRVDPAKAPKLGEPSNRPEVLALLVPGKWTLIDYWATWCEPCTRLGRQLEAYAQSHAATVAVKRLDATEWDRAQWEAMLPDASGLPVLDLYSPDGKLQAHLLGEEAFQYLAHLPADATPLTQN